MDVSKSFGKSAYRRRRGRDFTRV
uniref:Uncharacterized protein n=1 Tax=Rhizophora mucronata TaxID=61149 RepID=A0A2P2Q106_RHIMU